jgi:hypothetical protein
MSGPEWTVPKDLQRLERCLALRRRLGCDVCKSEGRRPERAVSAAPTSPPERRDCALNGVSGLTRRA